MLNKIFLMGRLTRDPEMRHTQNGTAVASFSIAVDRDFKDKQSGEKVTDFVDIVAWRSTAEFGNSATIFAQVSASSRLSILILKGTPAIVPVRMTCFLPDMSRE